MTAIIEKLITCAENHGEDSDPVHQVGDLEDMLRAAWQLMTPEQKRRFIQSDEVDNAVQCGARSEFEAGDLLNELVNE